VCGVRPRHGGESLNIAGPIASPSQVA
jgi:hypothetical protein